MRTGSGPGKTSVAGPTMPPALYDAFADAYRRLVGMSQLQEFGVAVRSSAVGEDGADASFAGQHDTYLNIVGEEAVADAIVRCWASINNPHALEYRRQRGLPLDGLRAAVLVQQLVPADVSAVVFGANPVTGTLDEVTIDASWGLGESIVGGTVTPGTFVVRKDALTVQSSQIVQKERMTVQTTGGTEEVDVPPVMQRPPSVSDDQVVEMARLTVDLETRMGWPADVECAYHDGHLYLLQCRPITTLGGG